MNNQTKILDWDSNFFLLKIASIESNDEDYIKQNLIEYKKQRFDLVYVFLDGEKELSSNVTSGYESRLVDSKLIYETDLLLSEKYNVASQIETFIGEPSELYNLAIQSGHQSRYKIDDNFISESFIKLYKTWVDNSVKKIIADSVNIYKTDNNIQGFITLKKSQDSVSIGLIATEERYRGKGIGHSLLCFAKEYTRSSGFLSLTVATQKNNPGACSFYEKNKFKVKSQTNIYHFWLKP